MAKLTDVLGQFPPPQPSRPAVDLLVTVGQQQEYLLFHNLLPPPGHPGALDALQARIRSYVTRSSTINPPPQSFLRLLVSEEHGTQARDTLRADFDAFVRADARWLCWASFAGLCSQSILQ